jgi:cysteine desulfuration protein SufE
MTLAEKQQELVGALSRIRNSQERFAYIVQRGRSNAALDAAVRTDSFRIEGCLAKLWFVPGFEAGRCVFRTDSDSAIVKGIAAILSDFYSGHSPEEILASDPAFLERVGITQHLTPNRRNSLSRIWERIRDFAALHGMRGSEAPVAP